MNDLPVEIHDAIMDNLDVSSLFSLGKVSRTLGHIVLRRTIPPAALEHICSHSEFVIAPDAPVTLIPAVTAAVWALKITTITYVVEREQEFRFLDDMRGLAILLSQLPGSLESLKVRIAFNYTRHQLQDSRKGDWPKTLGRLLGVAVSTGCNRIEMSYGPLPDLIRMGYSPPFYGPNALSRLWGNIRFRFMQINYKPLSQTTHATMKAVVFETPLFFTNSFMLRTIKNLQRVPCTIQHLTISPPAGSYRHFNCDPRTWAMFSSSVHLPHLTSLILKIASDTSVMTYDTLFEILSRHPNITFLTLDFFPWTWGVTVPEAAKKRNSILPKLETLEAQPQLISWLLPLTTHSGKRALIGHGRAWRRPLKSVHILTSYPAHVQALDSAILDLSVLFCSDDGTSNSSSSSPPIPVIDIRLEMNVQSWYWREWIRGHAEYGITNLTLVVNLKADPLFFLGVLRGFPELECLEFLGQPFGHPTLDEELYRGITNGCPRLKTLKFNGNVISGRT
ncbi:hypothetical protein P691DRAFT_800891 [Macrolepiota fuliginosa MF-IS2]|uniref:F-box domain-containing protein n=1 Tax=Macrolepiota fuliginosa MF-IS2 TaxID=1400762 RepID=A0A9P5XBM9_9AGAR|nr:hypothetical protein P691DRAFT_800891 [Macrolepiota fuliginosa MF-IS2]